MISLLLIQVIMLRFLGKLAQSGGIIESADDQPPYIALMVENIKRGVKEYLTLFKGN